MDLFELEKEQRLLEAKIKSQEERIELEKNKLGAKAIDYSKPTVQSSPHKDPMLDVFARISQMEQDAEYSIKRLKQNKKEVDRLYNIFREYNDRDKQIYIEKKFYHWNNDKISLQHNNISDRQIRRIIRNLERATKNKK